MSLIEVQLAIDRLKVELTRPQLEEVGGGGGGGMEEMRKNIVELQMKLQRLKEEEEEEVGVINYKEVGGTNTGRVWVEFIMKVGVTIV